MNPQTKEEQLREMIEEAIIATYPEDIFLPVPENQRAKNEVLAQAMRDMARPIAHISSKVFEDFLSSYKSELKERVEEIFWRGYEKGVEIQIPKKYLSDEEVKAVKDIINLV